jgi:Nucleotide modification associated domain 2
MPKETPLKLSAYIVRVDAGFAPNPFGRYCTLACCKPVVRRKAQPGDIIVGTGSARYGLTGHVIYAMRVQETIPYQRYWERPEFAYKIPSNETPESACGDNIWHKDSSGGWQVVPGALHDSKHKERDTSGECVLISTEFFYLGRKAIEIPPELSGILARTQGHRNTTETEIIERFWRWLTEECRESGRLGHPCDFDVSGCKIQCEDVEEEDFEEEGA